MSCATRRDGQVLDMRSERGGVQVGPRLTRDRERFPPNNVLLMLAGAGLLWLGWAGFNGGDPYAANIDASIAVLNTNVCAAASLLMWTMMDVLVFGKPSVIGAVQGMITGLVVITPAAGTHACIVRNHKHSISFERSGSPFADEFMWDVLIEPGVVQCWAAIVMGICAGSIPWFTMMVVHKRWSLLQRVDDTLGVFHTHAVAGFLGGSLTGLFAEPHLCNYFLSVTNEQGGFYGGVGGTQLGKQIAGALFIIGWNVVVTSIILNVIRLVVPLRMTDELLLVGDDAAHGEEAYALWGDGEKYDISKHSTSDIEVTDHSQRNNVGRGPTVAL